MQPGAAASGGVAAWPPVLLQSPKEEEGVLDSAQHPVSLLCGPSSFYDCLTKGARFARVPAYPCCSVYSVLLIFKTAVASSTTFLSSSLVSCDPLHCGMVRACHKPTPHEGWSVPLSLGSSELCPKEAGLSPKCVALGKKASYWPGWTLQGPGLTVAQCCFGSRTKCRVGPVFT